MADVKKLAEELVNLTVKEVNELATILKEEYGIGGKSDCFHIFQMFQRHLTFCIVIFLDCPINQDIF